MKIMPTTLREDAERYTEFMLKHMPETKEWCEPVRMAAWYISHGFAVAVRDKDSGRMMALLAARPVERPGIGVIPYYFNEYGTCMHVDILIDVSPDKRSLFALKAFCKIRFPQCTTIAMFRHFEERIRVYSLTKFWKSFELIKRIPKKKELQYVEA